MSIELEARLERIKRRGNLRAQLLKCFYARRSVAERYVDVDIALHVHGLLGDTASCATRLRSNDDRASDAGQVPVFVGIGDASQQPRLVASVTRLQSLDRCPVLIGQSTEEDAPPALLVTPSHDVPFRILDRKLCAMLNLLRIDEGEFINQVIDGRSQVVNDLPDEDAQRMGDGLEHGPHLPAHTSNLSAVWHEEGRSLALNDDVITYDLLVSIGLP